MGTLLNRRRYMGVGSSLPYDAEVEYLRIYGGYACISTGIQNSIDVVITGKVMQEIGNSIIGVNSTTCITNRAQFRWKGVNVGNVTAYNTIYTFVFGDDCYVDNVLVGSHTRTSYDEGEWYLFCRGLRQDPMFGRIYWMQFEKNGELVGDFIPVRIGQTGYMYDRISGQLFANEDTGTFILGPDKT